MKRIFPTGIPVLGNDLVGRQNEKERIQHLLRSGQSVVLYGPRRIGKTSLALTMLEEMKAEGFFVGHTDIFGAGTLDILSQQIVETTLGNKKLAQTITALKDSLSEAISKIEIKSIINDYEWILKFAERDTRPLELFTNSLDFPDQFSRRHGKHMIFFIDEIGDVGKFNSTKMIKLMRSKFQLHKNVTYLFAGSHESIIENIFIKRSGAFYRFARLSELNPVDKMSFKKYIFEKFNIVRIEADEKAIDALLELTNGHPYYTQLLCRELYFYALSKNRQVDTKAVEFATNEAIAIEEMYFDNLWGELSKHSSQVLLMQAMIRNKESLYNREIKTKINVSRTINQLITHGIIKKDHAGKYKFTDPLFEIYLKDKLG